MNTNAENRSFEIDATQYISLLKPKDPKGAGGESSNNSKSASSNSIGSFAAKCVFSNSPRFRTKAPSPKDGTYVTIEGYLKNFAVAPEEEYPHHFNVVVESITFLGRSTVTPPSTTPGKIAIPDFSLNP